MSLSDLHKGLYSPKLQEKNLVIFALPFSTFDIEDPGTMSCFGREDNLGNLNHGSGEAEQG